MKRQQKYITPIPRQLRLYLPVFTIAAVSFILYFSETYHPRLNFDWQGIRAEVKDTVNALDHQGQIYDRVVGYSGRTTSSYYRQRWFLKNATTKELQQLISYPNPVVKTLSYEGLLKRKSQDYFNVLKEILMDTTQVDYLSGCVGTRMAMNEYLVEHRFHLGLIPTTSPPPPGVRLDIDLSPEEIKELQTIYQKRNSIDEK